MTFVEIFFSSTLYTNPATTLYEFSNQFFNVLSSILDKHAPQKTITCRSQATQPFITPEIKEEKSKCSYLESIYRKNQTDPEIKARFKNKLKLPLGLLLLQNDLIFVI